MQKTLKRYKTLQDASSCSCKRWQRLGQMQILPIRQCDALQLGVFVKWPRHDMLEIAPYSSPLDCAACNLPYCRCGNSNACESRLCAVSRSFLLQRAEPRQCIKEIQKYLKRIKRDAWSEILNDMALKNDFVHMQLLHRRPKSLQQLGACWFQSLWWCETKKLY